MNSILVDGKRISVAFESFDDFKACAESEYERLKDTPRIGIDGKPTDDTSIFGSRQQILYHIVQMIEEYLKTHGIHSLESFYQYTKMGLMNCEAIYISSMSKYYSTIREYDEEFGDLEVAIASLERKKVTTDILKDKTGFLIAKAPVMDKINDLYDLLIEAKGEMETSASYFMNGRVARFAIKFCELGLRIFEDADTFDFHYLDTDIPKMSKGIRDRHKVLKEVRKKV